MATNPSTLPQNTGRITAADANYPYGSAKNDSTGTTGDGTPFEKALLNDIYGFQQWLLTQAGITPSGTADTALVSQYGDAMKLIAKTPTAVAAGTVNAITANFTPDVTLTNGVTVIVRASGANTSTTPTFAPDGLTAKTIVKQGNSPLVNGDIAAAGHWIILTFDSVLDKWVLANPAAQSAEFVSSLQTITAGGSLTIPHSLGVTPTDIRGELVCQVAEVGYSIGDIVPLGLNQMSASASYGAAVVPDGTNLNVRYGSSGGAFVLINFSTGGLANITPANWRFRLRARP